MDKKIILNFQPGSKGDLLINFLNGKINIDTDGRSMVPNESLLSRDLEEKFIGNLIEEDYFEKTFVQLLNEHPEKVIPSHIIKNLRKEYIELLCKNFVIFDIEIHSDFLLQAKIDLIFKNFIKPISKNLKIYYANKAKNKSWKNIKYLIDVLLLSELDKITNKDRIEKIYSYIDHYKKKIDRIEPNNIDFLTTINYNKLFLEPYSDVKMLCDFVGINFNIDIWKNAVQNSFLPEEIHCFETIFKPYELGYRRY